jgi:integrase
MRQLPAMTGGLGGGLAQPAGLRLAAPPGVSGVAAWLALATATPIDAAYVAAARSEWGYRLADLEPLLAARFTRTAAALGYSATQAVQQWSALAKLAAISGVPPGQLDRPRFDAARDALAAAVRARRGCLPNTLTTPLHGLQATLAAMGILDEAEGRRMPGRGIPARWDHLAALAPDLTATMRRYLAQLAISMRPGSVALADTTLRHFATYLTGHHPDVSGAALIGRTHIEGFKAWMAARPGYQGRRSPAATTFGMRISHLRCFFDRIIEWGYDDAPARNPVFAGDTPIRDKPLPRFLDDDAASRLLAAARQLPSLFDRLAVEVLARTGMRKGEFLRLATDAIVTIGDGEWLHVPVGKLRDDRYIPLHPRVKALLGQWLAQREGQPGKLMFTDHGRPVPQTRVDTAVRRAAASAGLGHVTPHQLRHTLATQAINRGMSLEAIAALLGHKSMSMTLTYARIADRTVASEYFAVSQQVEALYDAELTLPASAEGPAMHAIRAETTRRLLGNGYCTRPRDLGCQYETICENCASYATTIEFRDQIQAQEADARTHGDTSRQNTYLKILAKLKDTGA